MGEVLFVERSKSTDVSTISNVIVQQDNSRCTGTSSSITPREYATLNTVKRRMADRVFIQYASGAPVSIPPRLGSGEMRNLGSLPWNC
jgi:hypothetical protein